MTLKKLLQEKKKVILNKEEFKERREEMRYQIYNEEAYQNYSWAKK